MRIGIMTGATEGPGAGLDGLLAATKSAEETGFSTVWMANIFGLEAITALAVAGRETSRIELGTAVVPTYPRHPTVMAQHALTANAACDGRFVLGIGLSHKIVIEDMLGMSYDKPARHMREYLQVLRPLLDGEGVQHRGEWYQVAIELQFPQRRAPQLLLAALGPVMLDLAGRYADGTITWMTGPQTLAEHIAPKLRAAASEHGRGEPRIVAGLPIALTADVEGAKQLIAQQLAIYGQLPSYRAMLDREGAEGPADIALLGDETALRQGMQRLADAGVTDFEAAIVPVDELCYARTMEFLAGEL